METQNNLAMGRNSIKCVDLRSCALLCYWWIVYSLNVVDCVGKDRVVKMFDDSEVFAVYGEQRHHVTDWETFILFGYHDYDIEEVSRDELLAIPEGFPFLRVGGLDPVIRASENSHIFIVRNETRHRVPDWETFIDLGYTSDSINHVSLKTLNSIPLADQEGDATTFLISWKIYLLEIFLCRLEIKKRCRHRRR